MPGKPKKKTAARQSATNLIIQKIDQLRSDMEAGFKQTNEQLRAEMQSGNDQLRTEMRSGNDQLRSEMQTGFKEVNARIDNVEAKLTSLDEYTRSNILTFGRTINEITGEISKMINNARKRAQIALDEAQAETNSKVSRQGDEIVRLESSVDLVNGDLAQLRQDHDRLEQRVETLEAKPG
ncbi:hypothetical protein EDS67_17060 [candidate division KSB1 bacterium]|nr:MAG: hypothetical protein EDS67_17060 [candidate division KSB1 bacterium]MBC6950771.1 hypothetical protein [candidate division KSB1 bacterium]MCE7942947.1 hypothetical protein [Chlorobi bacterium CHB1]RIK77510.1 MAG: hypothetical protein DCC62_09430 [candidate division KSB1 bacterium]